MYISRDNMFIKIKNFNIGFLKNNNAVAAIEMAFVIPVLLVLMMGFLEFSIVFSLRSAIEQVSREISRIKLTSGLTTINGTLITTTNTADKLLTNLLHKKLVAIVFKPENTEICASYATTIQGFISNFNANQNCVIFSSNKNTSPSPSLNMGGAGNYVKIDIKYKHQYLTPIGKLINSLGTNLPFTSTTYFRNE